MEVQNLFANSRVNITNEGKRNLSAVIGSTEYRDEYVKDLIKDWDDQLLSAIAETHSQEAYSAFTSGFKNKLDCFLRNIPNILHLPLPLERTIRNKIYTSCNRRPDIQWQEKCANSTTDQIRWINH